MQSPCTCVRVGDGAWGVCEGACVVSLFSPLVSPQPGRWFCWCETTEWGSSCWFSPLVWTWTFSEAGTLCRLSVPCGVAHPATAPLSYPYSQPRGFGAVHLSEPWVPLSSPGVPGLSGGSSHEDFKEGGAGPSFSRLRCSLRSGRNLCGVSPSLSPEDPTGGRWKPAVLR